MVAIIIGYPLISILVVCFCPCCDCCKNKNEVSSEPTSDILNARNISSSVPNPVSFSSSHSTAEDRARETYFQAPQTQRMPEVVATNESGAHRQMATTNIPSAWYFAPVHAPRGARATPDVRPPSYDAVMRMKKLEIRHSN